MAARSRSHCGGRVRACGSCAGPLNTPAQPHTHTPTLRPHEQLATTHNISSKSIKPGGQGVGTPGATKERFEWRTKRPSQHSHGRAGSHSRAHPSPPQHERTRPASAIGRGGDGTRCYSPALMLAESPSKAQCIRSKLRSWRPATRTTGCRASCQVRASVAAAHGPPWPNGQTATRARAHVPSRILASRSSGLIRMSSRSSRYPVIFNAICLSSMFGLARAQTSRGRIAHTCSSRRSRRFDLGDTTQFSIIFKPA